MRLSNRSQISVLLAITSRSAEVTEIQNGVTLASAQGTAGQKYRILASALFSPQNVSRFHLCKLCFCHFNLLRI